MANTSGEERRIQGPVVVLVLAVVVLGLGGVIWWFATTGKKKT